MQEILMHSSFILEILVVKFLTFFTFLIKNGYSVNFIHQSPENIEQKLTSELHIECKGCPDQDLVVTLSIRPVRPLKMKFKSHSVKFKATLLVPRRDF